MSFIQALDINNTSTQISIRGDSIDSCPICHAHIVPSLINNYLNAVGSNSPLLQRIYRCPNTKCGMIFFALYVRKVYPGFLVVYHFCELEPMYPKEPIFSNKIKNDYPSFYKIYKQANRAEELGLSEICGMGYRKSIEFLIKDFIKRELKQSKTPKEEIVKIIKTSLSKCIEKYITDPEIKSMATRATWLGNDETHYYKKWPKKNISDLKILIQLTIYYIESHLLSKKYEKHMDKPKK